MVHPKPITAVERIERAAGNDPLPGIDWNTPRPAYKSPFFGAQREWPNDEVGWTKIPRTKTVQRGEVRLLVRVTHRDINRLEKRVAGWNLLDVDA